MNETITDSRGNCHAGAHHRDIRGLSSTDNLLQSNLAPQTDGFLFYLPYYVSDGSDIQVTVDDVAPDFSMANVTVKTHFTAIAQSPNSTLIVAFQIPYDYALPWNEIKMSRWQNGTEPSRYWYNMTFAKAPRDVQRGVDYVYLVTNRTDPDSGLLFTDFSITFRFRWLNSVFRDSYSMFSLSIPFALEYVDNLYGHIPRNVRIMFPGSFHSLLFQVSLPSGSKASIADPAPNHVVLKEGRLSRVWNVTAMSSGADPEFPSVVRIAFEMPDKTGFKDLVDIVSPVLVAVGISLSIPNFVEAYKQKRSEDEQEQLWRA